MKPDWQRIYFQGANATISAVVFGEQDLPVVIAVHGLRDHALGLSEVLKPLSAQFRIVALDLRGHGHSDKVATYTMIQFMADLKALYDHLEITSAKLIGHSLGGHIVMRFAATFPDLVDQMVLLDGMGPPGMPDRIIAEQSQEKLRDGVLMVSAITGQRRSLAGIDDAKRRLRENNPLLSEQLLELIVEEGTEPHPEGGLRWRWESAVNMIWHTFLPIETESMIPLITCPVLIVTGDRGLDYWTAMNSKYSDVNFYSEELLRREKLFSNGRHVVITDAGHMLHYDQPEAVFDQLNRFFN